MKRKVTLLVGLLLFVVVLPISFFRIQEQHRKIAYELVQRELRDESSPLSLSIIEQVGAFKDVYIEGAYAHVHWRKAIVDGRLTAGPKRYWFRCIVKNGEVKLEAIVPMKGPTKR